jgi:hypothetical protein
VRYFRSVESHRIQVTVTGLNGSAANLLHPALRHATLAAVYTEYRRAGLSGKQIAERLGISRSMVYADLGVLGLSFGRGRTSAAGRKEQLAGLANRAEQQREAANQRMAAGVKACAGCAQIKDLAEFNKSPRMRDGHRSRCRDCERQQQRAGRLAGKLKGAGSLTSSPLKTCSLCKRTLPVAAFYVDRSRRGGRRPECRECANVRDRARQREQAAARREPETVATRRTPAGSNAAVQRELALREQAQRLGIRAYRLNVVKAELYEPRDCCYGNGNGVHEISCPFGLAGRLAGYGKGFFCLPDTRPNWW